MFFLAVLCLCLFSICCQPNATLLSRRMFEEGDDYHLLVHNGDISYARGYSSQVIRILPSLLLSL